MKVYTAATVAKFLGLTERRIKQMEAENIITSVRPGLFELQKVTQQYIAYIKQGSNVDYNIERAKLVKAKRQAEEIELKLMQNQVHESAEIEKVWTDMLVNFKTRLMAIPAKLSPVLSNKYDKTEIFNILKSSVDETLNELSDFDSIMCGNNES